jgi:hypothetical protein
MTKRGNVSERCGFADQVTASRQLLTILCRRRQDPNRGRRGQGLVPRLGERDWISEQLEM